MRFIISVLCVVLFSCSSIKPYNPILEKYVMEIKMSEEYKILSIDEKDLVDEIINKIEKNNSLINYFPKLILLINTPYKKDYSEIKQMNDEEMDDEIKQIRIDNRSKSVDNNLEEYLDIEESYELEKDRNWKTISPNIIGPSFYIVKDDPLDILIHINIRFVGDKETIFKMMLLEDAVEKHLSKKGFSVNIVFTGIKSNKTFNVEVDCKHWANSKSFCGDRYTFAHELFHILGLPDEYDLADHAENKFISMKERLLLFSYQMSHKILPDSKEGIMVFSRKKPLERQICAIAKLGKECVNARNKAFNVGDKQ